MTTTMIEARAPFEGPLTRKLPRKTRKKVTQLKLILVQIFHQELSEKYGGNNVDRWMKQVIRHLSQF